MSNPLHAAYYADRAVQRRAEVVENVPIARDTYRVRLACPDIARAITPGQFVMVRLAGFDDPLLGRPLALWDTVLDDSPEGSGCPSELDLVYLVVGKLTGKLAQCRAGQVIDVWGPLGNGFFEHQADHLVMVAGGIGQTPFPAVARECLGLRRYGNPLRAPIRAGRVTLCYGARSAEYLAGVEDFRALGVDVRLSTDDGSAGHHGLVTDVLEQVLDESPVGQAASLPTEAGRGRGSRDEAISAGVSPRSETLDPRSFPPTQIVCCGPEPMMEAVSALAQRRKVPCQVSLETPMACGIGICFSCVAKVKTPDGAWDYQRTCVEGPVFDAQRIVW